MKTLIVLLFATLIVSCGNYREVKQDPSSQPSGQGGVIETRLDFETIKERILRPRCIECHENRHTAYEDYNVVKASINGIMTRVSIPNPALRMPKDAPALPASELAMLREWVAAGAPEFANNSGEDSGGDDDSSGDELLSFSDIKERVLKPQCIACHTHFNDYRPVKERVGSILSLVLSDKMPFPKRKGDAVVPLSQPEKKLLMDWVAQGAPEFAGDTNVTLPPVELKPTWISLRNNILGPKCIHCHNSFGPRAPTFMGTHKDVREWFSRRPNLFNFDDPEESHFIGSMRGRVDDDEFFFDPMPLNLPVDDVPTDLPPVSDDEIEVIKRWIELKLPYNEEEL